MSETAQTDMRATLERVRLEVLSLLAKSRALTLDKLYQSVREALGWDTDMAVAAVVSLLCRARVIIMEPLQYGDPSAGMQVSILDPDDAALAL